MSKSIQMPLFSGRLGNVIFYVQNGKQVARLVPEKVKNPRTPKQEAARSRLKASAQWLSPIKEVLHTGFASLTSTRPYSRASSLLLQNAMVDTTWGASVDASKAQVAEGNLAPVSGGTISSEGRSVTITWTDNSAALKASSSDLFVYLLYNPATRRMLSNHQALRAPRRTTGQCTIKLPSEAEGTYHAYAFFSNTKRTDASNSVYLGEVRV